MDVHVEPMPMPPGTVQFSELTNDNIIAILDLLPFKQLIETRFTCKRFHELANSTFARKHWQNKWVIVTSKYSLATENREVYFKHTGAYYPKQFSRYIRNIRVECQTDDTFRLFKFIKMNCCNNLHHLELQNFFGPLFESHGEVIKDQLNSLTRLTINNMYTSSDIYDGLLKFCVKLELLEVDRCISNISLHVILAPVISKLMHLKMIRVIGFLRPEHIRSHHLAEYDFERSLLSGACKTMIVAKIMKANQNKFDKFEINHFVNIYLDPM